MDCRILTEEEARKVLGTIPCKEFASISEKKGNDLKVISLKAGCFWEISYNQKELPIALIGKPITEIVPYIVLVSQFN